MARWQRAAAYTLIDRVVGAAEVGEGHRQRVVELIFAHKIWSTYNYWYHWGLWNLGQPLKTEILRDFEAVKVHAPQNTPCSPYHNTLTHKL